ncbi:MAG: hypothetical protein M3321_08400 [Actinomycetota bacterium]|nr:hypothetical protein [Actinomycetota bacterium]
MASPRTPVLFVHHRSELGGAPASLSYLIRELDESHFEPHIYCPPGPAAELFRESGARVHTGPVAGFTHIWASTYRGAGGCCSGASSCCCRGTRCTSGGRFGATASSWCTSTTRR